MDCHNHCHLMIITWKIFKNIEIKSKTANINPASITPQKKSQIKQRFSKGSGLRRCLWEKINENHKDPRFAPRPGHLLKGGPGNAGLLVRQLHTNCIGCCNVYWLDVDTTQLQSLAVSYGFKLITKLPFDLFQVETSYGYDGSDLLQRHKVDDWSSTNTVVVG